MGLLQREDGRPCLFRWTRGTFRRFQMICQRLWGLYIPDCAKTHTYTKNCIPNICKRGTEKYQYAYKTCGPDNISRRILKELKERTAPVLILIFKRTLNAQTRNIVWYRKIFWKNGTFSWDLVDSYFGFEEFWYQFINQWMSNYYLQFLNLNNYTKSHLQWIIIR